MPDLQKFMQCILGKILDGISHIILLNSVHRAWMKDEWLGGSFCSNIAASKVSINILDVYFVSYCE